MLMPLLLATLLLFVTYSYMKLRHKQFSQCACLPQLPPSLLFGHLKTIDEYIRRGAADRHPDTVFSEMREALGRPPLIFVSKASSLFPTSTPKANLKHFAHLIGSTPILASHGDEWKSLRKRFNPGFAPQYLVTLVPFILDKTLPFMAHLDDYALMDVDLEAQHLGSSDQGSLVRLFSELLGAYSDDMAGLPWWFIPRTEMKRRRLGKSINVLVDDFSRREFPEELGKSAAEDKSRSILALSLGHTESLSLELIDVTCDQLKTFLLAEHDTASLILAWVFYELLLGADTSPEAVRTSFLSPDGPEIVHKMAHVSAVIKETLRLHPPAGAARLSGHGTGFTVHTLAGEDYCLDGVIIYNCETIIHRDPAVYGDSANRFVSERWLNEGDASPRGLSTTRRVPASFWRPFERGPLSCIGQELASFETCIIIAFAARRYDFTKVGLDEIARDGHGRPIMNEKGNYQLKLSLYNTRQVTSKPVDGMKVRVCRAGKVN
ncbi:cytochrome P450 [Xylaria acuta]|nr:cytochrome P450 [Xylaria acuta]